MKEVDEERNIIKLWFMLRGWLVTLLDHRDKRVTKLTLILHLLLLNSSHLPFLILSLHTINSLCVLYFLS